MEITEPIVVPPAADPTKSLNVLVVENDASSRELLARVLRLHGCHADTTIGAEQARAALLQNRYDLLVTDLRMQPVDGVELLKSVASMDPARRPEGIIVLSGYLPDYYERLAALGLQLELFQKPLHLPSLISILTRLRQPRAA
jgi:two-component system response regulator FlrC